MRKGIPCLAWSEQTRQHSLPEGTNSVSLPELCRAQTQKSSPERRKLSGSPAGRALLLPDLPAALSAQHAWVRAPETARCRWHMLGRSRWSRERWLHWPVSATQMSRGNHTDWIYWWPVCLFLSCLASKMGKKLCLEA